VRCTSKPWSKPGRWKVNLNPLSTRPLLPLYFATHHHFVVFLLSTAASETSEGQHAVVLQPPHRVVLHTQSTGQEQRTIEADFVYTAQHNNHNLCIDALHPLIDRALLGYNALILAYGSSGTGKAHTMRGKRGEVGIVEAAANRLFSQLSTLSDTASFITLSFYQISGTTIVDLLAPDTTAPLQLSDHRTYGALVVDVTQLECQSADELNLLVRQAYTTSDALVRRSATRSKPHLVIEWRVEVQTGGMTRSSLVRFVQCAGSGGVSLQFNPGLQSLAQCMAALAAGKQRWDVPFSGSALTRLCEYGLGGSGYGLFVCCIDGKDVSLPDTMHGLEMCERARKIKSTPASNRNTTQAQISHHTTQHKRPLITATQLLHD